MNKNIIKVCVLLILAATMPSCSEDFLTSTPSEKLSDKNGEAFNSLEKMQLILTGTYDWISNGQVTHNLNQYIFQYPDLMADDAYVNPTGNYGRFVPAYQYTVDPTSTYAKDPWWTCYSLIDNANAIISNIDKLEKGDENNRIKGEALALRAYAYHFLIRLYAKPVNKYPDSPGVILKVDYGSDYNAPRATVKAVYEQMVKDLTLAVSLLKNNDEPQKTYIDKRAAAGILARVYLDLGDEVNGVIAANTALDGVNLMEKNDYKTVFCDNNSETLWSFECTTDDNQFYLSLPSFWFFADGYDEDKDEYINVVEGYSSLRVSQNLCDIVDPADVRSDFFPKSNKGNLVRYGGGIITNKIRSRSAGMGQGAINYLRGSEMYLIIAELKADKGLFPDARKALNVVRVKRGLPVFAGTDNQLVNEIQDERRRELFAEGHRLFDLKRRNLPLVRKGVEGHTTWGSQLDLPAGSDRFELPIPQDELNANKALTPADQNPAYLNKK